MTNKVGFAIPGLYENFKINKLFIEFQKENPECFYEDIKIDAVFGNFQFCIWDGGRIFDFYQHATIEQVQNIQHFFNDENNIPIRFVYTNNQLKEKDLNNRFCNLVTEICENELNEIVINSPLLEDYLRNKFPKYKFISSTTKCLKKQDNAKEELNKEDYYKVCLDYNLNHNLNFLQTLNQEEKEKVEFLVNPICGANCKNRKKHYKLNSIFSLTYGKQYRLDNCAIPGHSVYPFDPNKRNELLIDDILNIYKPMGFYSYKIEGRTFNPLLHLENCIKYFIKPEYYLFAISTIYERFEAIKNDQNY